MTIPPGALLKAGGFLALLGLETLAPYRPPTQSRVRRWAANVTLAVANALVLQLLLADATAKVARQGGGLLAALNLPPTPRLVVALILLDLAAYLWHRANHRAGLLWRVHRVHHSDLDMDVTTAGRFHLIELGAWTIVKLGLALGLGLTVAELLIFDTLFVSVSQFQHSALKLPAGLEKALEPLTFGPTHHRIHHSVVIAERNTNYGTLLSLWDRLFRSHSPYRDSTGITLGVGGHPTQLGLPALLKLPFARATR